MFMRIVTERMRMQVLMDVELLIQVSRPFSML